MQLGILSSLAGPARQLGVNTLINVFLWHLPCVYKNILLVLMLTRQPLIQFRRWVELRTSAWSAACPEPNPGSPPHNGASSELHPLLWASYSLWPGPAAILPSQYYMPGMPTIQYLNI